MSHFYGTLQGSKGQTTRQGTKKSGIESRTASWQGAVRVSAFHDEETGEDWVEVRLEQWQSVGQLPSKLLYRGPIGRYEAEDDSNELLEALESSLVYIWALFGDDEEELEKDIESFNLVQDINEAIRNRRERS